MEKKTFEQAKQEAEARRHNSNMENLASATNYVTEEKLRLQRELAELDELQAEIDAAGNNENIDHELVWALYNKACGRKFNRK